MTLLSVQNLTAGYAKLPVIHDVSLTVQPNETVALVGPNGAGKS
ncbi:ATP-binding cassette domain-containing protein, partial [Mycolicibacterium sphagni]